ncbi:MAG: bifunctional diaminohydroxyphosphoribosylaminopyrimidine deaminase/5-amino-6-(5-phosphoribosylamino)uracil reductase RibD, partial [Coriobacteriaceae bacterium]|nr:bifunctional diaminohydroxyphosphoribosylaminopyrimidine deaminase/5-amino-6-(5-phosphoribosylamino)uracil reductase RibD [Coriobacteriaceae bacterium]
MNRDEEYMHLALREAEKGLGWTDPNPLVGAVIVYNDEILATGWHAAFGELHAERHALSRCEDDCTGATMYVTLEPCCHTGKQPPCTDAIIEAGIAKVVVACTDPNPL